MPRLVHTLCCCLRPPNNYNKKNDTASNSENPDSRSSPITQASKGQPSKSIAPHLAGDLRQRLTPRNEGSKGHNLAQRTQNAANNNNNTLTLMTNEVPRNKQQHANEQQHNFLLQRVLPIDLNRKCLVVDLDETLVHSSFKPVKNADFVIPVEIDNVVHQVYVLKRPHTDHFLERIGYLFECVLFTASLAKYADPVADLLDKKRIFRSRLFRESCVYFEGNYVKDLERLGRDLRKVVIIDNSPASYAFHPDNAIAVRTWFDDPNDTELLDLLPMLEELAQSDDIYSVLGTVPPHQQPRCLTPSEDLIQPPPIASSSPITQVTPNNNGTTQQPQQPWKRDRSALRLSSSPFNEMRRTVTMDAVPSGTRR